MCGIVGFLSKEKKYNCDTIRKMMTVQAHRGPSDAGVCALDYDNSRFVDIDSCGEVASFSSWLGFNRLSIRDISKNGHQPMFNTEKTIAIIYNGEIYNNKELNREYLDDVVFKSNTDTETILHLYEKVGIEKTTKLLNGMFAFCIIDFTINKAFLARDRVGIKPLFFYSDNNLFVFSSEMKSIIASGLINCSISKTAVYENIVFGSSLRHSLINDIDIVAPGSFLQIDLKTLNISKEVFWDPVKEMKKKRDISFEEAKKELDLILTNVVNSQMVSDVPLGCQLSGGVDSSLVTYYLSKNAENQNNDNIKLWGIGITPSDSKYSEIEYMEHAADITGVKLETYPLFNEWVVDNWRKAVWHSDGIPEFVNDLGIMKLAEKAGESVTVLLSGEGSDELFAGYWWIASVDRLYKAYCVHNKSIIKISKITHFFDKIFKLNNKCTSKDYIRDYMLFGQDAISDNSMNEIFANFDECMEQIYFDRKKTIKYICDNHSSILDRMRLRDLMLRLPVLLNRQDKMTMASSIENRVPLLDNEVIDFAFSIPNKYLTKIVYNNHILEELIHTRNPISINGKYILKDIVSDIFGKEFAYRGKMGFGLPVEEFIKIYYKKEEYTDTRKKLENRNLINIDYFDSVIKRIIENKAEKDDVKLAWRIISLEMFFEETIDKYN